MINIIYLCLLLCTLSLIMYSIVVFIKNKVQKQKIRKIRNSFKIIKRDSDE